MTNIEKNTIYKKALEILISLDINNSLGICYCLREAFRKLSEDRVAIFSYRNYVGMDRT